MRLPPLLRHATALLVVHGAVLCPRGRAAEDLPPPAVATPSEASRGLAVSSCSSTACHGGPKAGNHDVQSFAATIWMNDDPHARAYQVLHDPRSQRMARLLGLGPAHEAQRCLACHSVQAESHDPLPKHVLADGVGCASCHGDAARWEGRHFLPEWKSLTDRQRAALGYKAAGTPLERARTCVRCHVGADDREVDHDLIAAGHPRLFFELAAYQRLWPRHWSPRGKAEAQADFTERSWAVGQAAALEAAAQLLAKRVVRAADESSPPHAARWPEFAEFDCYACHQTLGSDGPDGTRYATHRPPGAPAWQPWHVAGARLLAVQAGADAPETRAVAAGVAEVRRLLDADWADADRERLNRLLFEARGLADAAGRSAEELTDRPRVVLDCSPATLDRLVAKAPGDWRAWDGAAQMYLAIEAARAGGPARHDGRGAGGIRDALDSLRDSLRFPPTIDAPQNFDADRFQRDRANVP